MDLFSTLHPSQASTPSIFELVAQEQLHNLLSPALRSVLASYAIRYPRYLLRVLQYHDELFALLMIVVQRHYLRTSKASFAESFYGLKRARTVRVHRSDDLTPSDVRKSLFCLVVVPYIKQQLHELHREWSTELGTDVLGDESDSGSESDAESVELPAAPQTAAARRRTKLKRLFLKIYPLVHFLYTGTHLVYQLLYMFDWTRYYSPLLHVLGVEVKRVTSADMRAMQRLAASAPPRTGLAAAGHVALEALKVGLPVAIFFSKFLDWFATTDYARQERRRVPIPPPPPRVQPDPKGIPLPKDPRTCPLCCRAVTNAAALPTGVVYCYPCVFRAVQDNGVCPVTRKPVEVGDVRRVFQSQ
ncbi:ubiquitin-protein ligase peroxin 12 [Allomyces arbusculus]|nr:ubiquitin-protein ligase peroxin 12 [Allomyces arbusculus]